jgi:hypothetical protein
MALFNRWRSWQGMSSDLMRGLYNLTFRDNMPGQPQVKDYLPTVGSPASWQIYAINVTSARWWKIGPIVTIEVIVDFKTPSAGSPFNNFVCSLPIPAGLINLNAEQDPLIGIRCEIKVPAISGTHWIPAIPAYSTGVSNFVAVNLRDATMTIASFTNGEQYYCRIFGSYVVGAGYENVYDEVVVSELPLRFASI